MELVTPKQHSRWSRQRETVGLDGSDHLVRPVGPIPAPWGWFTMDCNRPLAGGRFVFPVSRTEALEHLAGSCAPFGPMGSSTGVLSGSLNGLEDEALLKSSDAVGRRGLCMRLRWPLIAWPHITPVATGSNSMPITTTSIARAHPVRPRRGFKNAVAAGSLVVGAERMQGSGRIAALYRKLTHASVSLAPCPVAAERST
jgi:hypothetical protein